MDTPFIIPADKGWPIPGASYSIQPCSYDFPLVSHADSQRIGLLGKQLNSLTFPLWRRINQASIFTWHLEVPSIIPGAGEETKEIGLLFSRSSHRVGANCPLIQQIQESLVHPCQELHRSQGTLRFIHPFNKHFLNTCYRPEAVLGTGSRAENKTVWPIVSGRFYSR